MTDKTTEALELAEALENDAKEHREVSYGLDCPPERTANWQHALNCEAAARLIREALAEQSKCACDSPAWCTKYKKCNREMLGLPKAQPVKQEPVAVVVAMLDKCISIIGTEMTHCKQAGDKWFMCQRFIHAIQDMQYEFKRDYAAPVSAKREWVELTDYEIVRLYDESPMCDSEMIAFARAVIAAFKEKNK